MIIYICIYRGYNEKVVRQQILKARKFTRKDLTKISKLKGKINLSLILLTIQPIQNLKIFYQIFNTRCTTL